MLSGRIQEDFLVGAMAAYRLFGIMPPAISVFRIVAGIEHSASADTAYTGAPPGKDKAIQSLCPGELCLLLCLLHGIR